MWSDFEKKIQGAQLHTYLHLHFKFHENPAHFLKTSKNYFKSTILKLEKTKTSLEILFFVSIKHVNCFLYLLNMLIKITNLVGNLLVLI